MNTSILQQELAPLNAQIDQAREKLALLEDNLRAAEAELETYSADRQRFDALAEVCTALDKLEELDAAELFWEGAPQIEEAAGHRRRIGERVAAFEEEIRTALEKQQALEGQVEEVEYHLEDLYDEVRQAYAREERRRDEFAIEREPSALPFRLAAMPWSGDDESESRFRRALMVAMTVSLLFGALIPMVNLPIIDRADQVVEIPERLAMLVKKEPPRPEPVSLAEAKPEPEPEKPVEEKKPEPEKPKPQKTAKAESKPKPQETVKAEPKAAGPGKNSTKAARKKAESTGVLAFKDSFADLVEETPVARLGTEARIDKDAPRAAGQARPTRSLVATQAKGGSSGGIANARVSRNLGSGGTGNAGRIGGVGIAKVESAVAGLTGEGLPGSGGGGSGAGLGRTDEEIQIVFDRYKATLYRIYNKELRKDPTLRGKLLLKLTIDPDGAVSACGVESTDLGSQVLVSKIVTRVERFNFGPKDGVPQITILYPIDFLPAG